MKRTPVFPLVPALGLILVLLLFAAVPAWARWEFTPRFQVSEEYNDNIFLEHEDEAEDWITNYEPGFSLARHSNKLDLTLDYSLYIMDYRTYDGEDETDFRDTQRGTLEAVLFPDGDFSVRASGAISRIRINERSGFADENDAVNTSTLYHLELNPTYRLRLGRRTNVVFGYLFTIDDYATPTDDYASPLDDDDSSDLNDYLEHTGSLGLERLFGRDSTLSLTYNYTEHDEDGNGSGGIDDLGGEDFTQHNVMLELAHQVGHRLTLEAGLGWVAIDYDSSDYGSMNEIVWNLGAEYLLSDRVTSSLSYTRDYITSVDQGVALEDEARVRLSYGKRLTAGLELFANRLKYKEADIEDRIAGALWDLHVPVGRRLYLDFGFEYGILRFLPEKEDSQRYEATASVGGAWRHLNLDLEYRFRHEDSDLRENTFHNNVAVLTLGWTF